MLISKTTLYLRFCLYTTNNWQKTHTWLTECRLSAEGAEEELFHKATGPSGSGYSISSSLCTSWSENCLLFLTSYRDHLKQVTKAKQTLPFFFLFSIILEFKQFSYFYFRAHFCYNAEICAFMLNGEEFSFT